MVFHFDAALAFVLRKDHILVIVIVEFEEFIGKIFRKDFES
jgi:hypothetical protein